MKTNTLTEPIETPFKPLQEGQYTYYTIESRLTHNTPTKQRPKKLKTPEPWTSNIVSKTIAEPWTGTGNNYKPKYKQSYEETREVERATGRTGWWTLENAIKAMNRLTKASKTNKLTWESPYGTITNTLRYEFRIVKITVSKIKKVITIKKKPKQTDYKRLKNFQLDKKTAAFALGYTNQIY